MPNLYSYLPCMHDARASHEYHATPDLCVVHCSPPPCRACTWNRQRPPSLSPSPPQPPRPLARSEAALELSTEVVIMATYTILQSAVPRHPRPPFFCTAHHKIHTRCVLQISHALHVNAALTMDGPPALITRLQIQNQTRHSSGPRHLDSPRPDPYLRGIKTMQT